MVELEKKHGNAHPQNQESKEGRAVHEEGLPRAFEYCPYSFLDFGGGMYESLLNITF
jgi:hypothetical protein